MGWLIAAAVLVLLAWIPLGIRAGYDEEGFAVSAEIWVLRFRLYPVKKKKKPKEKKKEQKKAPSSGKKPEEKKKKGGSITDFLPLLDIVLDLLWDFKEKLRVKRLEAVITLAGGDPCDLAVNYGRAWAAMEGLIPLLEQCFVIQKRDLRVECDFTGDKTRIQGLLELTVMVGRLLWLILRYGWKGFRSYRAIMNQRKGGAAQ